MIVFTGHCVMALGQLESVSTTKHADTDTVCTLPVVWHQSVDRHLAHDTPVPSFTSFVFLHFMKWRSGFG